MLFAGAMLGLQLPMLGPPLLPGVVRIYEIVSWDTFREI